MSTAFPIIPDTRYRISTASSNQTSFTVAFPFLAPEEVTVHKISLAGVMTQLSRPANYNITGAGNPSGGTITLKVGAKAGEKLLIIGTASRTRAQDITRGGKYSTSATDVDFDRLTIIAQELDRDLGRAVKVPYGSNPPLLEPGTANSLAVWDAAGNLAGGPDAAAIEALDTALAVDAGRALVYPPSPADPVYDAHGRPIRNVADGVDLTDAATKGQLDALEAAIGVPAIDARFDALETTVGQGWVTGDLKISLFDDAQDGWLLVNAQTIGSESSGATARADADTHALFLRIWAKYDNTLAHIQTSAGVDTTRGASAEADWAAHRRLPLLAVGGEFLRFLDMGRGVDSGRVLGSAQGDLVKTHDHLASFTGTPLGPHGHTLTRQTGHGANGGGPARWSDGDTGGANGSNTTDAASAGTPAGTVAVAGNNGGGAENRPRNIAFPLFVKL